ncbi:hypothetical protein HAX54_006794, partial [Datura stramonium]|nr:hypothetical protein [Datura stramonium]
RAVSSCEELFEEFCIYRSSATQRKLALIERKKAVVKLREVAKSEERRNSVKNQDCLVFELGALKGVGNTFLGRFVSF